LSSRCFLGSDQTTEAENFDRESLELAGAQEQLLRAVAAVKPGRVVLVLVHGGPIAVQWAAASGAVVAILDAFQPGELGADAIIDALAGSTIDGGDGGDGGGDGSEGATTTTTTTIGGPAGLLPYTTYFANYTARDIREVDLRAGPAGTTYWWHTAPVLFPFGFGLSYSSFDFRWQQVEGGGGGGGERQEQEREQERGQGQLPPLVVALPEAGADNAAAWLRAFGGGVTHTVVVTNTGDRTADVVVTAFLVADPHGNSPTDTPLRKLFGFERFRDVPPGENRTAFFETAGDALGIVGEDGSRWLLPGTYRLECGGTGMRSGGAAVAAGGAASRELRIVGDAPLLVEANEWVQKARSPPQQVD
jgi:hypothetical protein